MNTDCKRETFTLEPSDYAGSNPKARDLILTMASNGAGIGDTARTLNVSRTTVSRVLCSIARKLVARNPTIVGNIRNHEVDEIQGFVGKKKQFTLALDGN